MKKALYLILVTLIIDQITKIFFPTTKNYGAAFGILQNQTIFLIIISILVIILALTYVKKLQYQIPLALIISGTTGNLIDRIFLGYVRDFINLKIWPSFNIADTIITIGLIWLIIQFTKKTNITKN